MKTIANYSAFERVSSNMAKEFGTIKKGAEKDYILFMLPIESNLIKMGRKTGNKNGRRAMEAIKICLFTIDGYINGWEYDFSNYLTPENKDFVHGILMAIDPFTNQQLYKVLDNEYYLDKKEDLREYFTTPVKCLLRIEVSMQQETKDYGTSGYFDFLENHMGDVLPDDYEMQFIDQSTVEWQKLQLGLENK